MSDALVCCRFYASACFSLLYIIIVSVFRFLFGCLGRSGGVFIRVCSKSVFCVYSGCFSDLLPILLLSWLFVVFLFTILALDSLDGRLSSVCVYFLHLVVFVCELLGMYFLSRCCVFCSISPRIFVIYVFFNVLEVAVVRESRVLLFTSLFVLRALFHGFDLILPC